MNNSQIAAVTAGVVMGGIAVLKMVDAYKVYKARKERTAELKTQAAFNEWSMKRKVDQAQEKQSTVMTDLEREQYVKEEQLKKQVSDLNRKTDAMKANFDKIEAARKQLAANEISADVFVNICTKISEENMTLAKR